MGVRFSIVEPPFLCSVQSDPGRRISCKTLSLLGGSSLGVANSLGLADLIMAPGMFP